MNIKKALIGVTAIGAAAALAFGGTSVATAGSSGFSVKGTTQVAHVALDHGTDVTWSNSEALVPLDNNTSCKAHADENYYWTPIKVSSDEKPGPRDSIDVQNESGIPVVASMVFDTASRAHDSLSLDDMKQLHFKYTVTPTSDSTFVDASTSSITGTVSLYDIWMNRGSGPGLAVSLGNWEPGTDSAGGGSYHISLATCLDASAGNEWQTPSNNNGEDGAGATITLGTQIHVQSSYALLHPTS